MFSPAGNGWILNEQNGNLSYGIKWFDGTSWKLYRPVIVRVLTKGLKVEKKTGGLRWTAYFSTTPFSSRSDGQIKFKLEREEADLCESGRELVRLLSEADFDAV